MTYQVNGCALMHCFYCHQEIRKDESIWEGLHQPCFCEWFGVDSAESFSNVVARTVDSVEGNFQAITTSFFHGKFRKYSAQLADKHYILKVEQEDVPELPATEFLCNQIAHDLGLMVPKHYLIKFQGALVTFVVDNFMQNKHASNLIHLYRFLESPSDFSCEGILKVIEEKVGRYTNIARFVELCLFDSLIGNHDRHGRNLGLIQKSEGYELAPFYDNPSYLAIEVPFLLSAQHEPRGAIATASTKDPTMKDYVDEWCRLGMKNDVEEFLKKVNLESIFTKIDNSFISTARKEALKRLIKNRQKELIDAI